MDYVFHILNMVLITTILVASLNLILGYGGMASLCHAVLAGIGGYLSALVCMHWGLNFMVGMIGAMALAGGVGLVLALPSLRIRDEYLILFTSAFQLVIWGLMVNEISITRGETGLSLIPRMSLFGVHFLSPRSYLAIITPLAVLFFLVCWRVGHSPFGRVLKCIREDETATRALGKNVLRFKVLTFMVGGMVAGAAGSMLAHYNAYLNPVSFDLDSSILLVAMVVLGGSANMFGSVLGSFLLIGIPEALRFLPGTATVVGPLRSAVYGGLLILFMRFRPQGLIPEHVGRQRPPAGLPGPLSAAEIKALLQGPNGPEKDLNGPPVIEVKGLSKAFGGIKAVNAFSMTLRAGKLTTLVGPNGCGKTTVFNLISGFLDPDQGSIFLRGQDVTRFQPHELVKLGIIRSWQDVRIFRNMTVLDNVMVAQPEQRGENLLALFLRPGEVSRQEKENYRHALVYLSFVGLAEKVGHLAGELSFAEQKQLSIARLLATRCSILLLDEPASGIDLASIKLMSKLVLQLAASGKTICLVEHNLDLVKELSDESYFMDQGRMLRQASPAELMADPQLAQIYFGS